MTQEQKYLQHHEDDSIMLFSPFTDALEIQCDTPNIRSNIHSLDIEIGLNKVFLPPNCVGQTSQVSIFPDFKPTEDAMILAPSITILNISEGIYSLSNDLEQIHDINMTTMAVHFQSYVNASKIESLKSINDFKTIKKLNDYIPETIDFEDPDSVCTTASVLSWLVSLFLLMGACGLCVKFGNRVPIV